MPSKTSSSAEANRQGARSGAAGGATKAGERDEHYDLVSALYHALQGAETVARCVADARAARDQELTSFFEETRTEYLEVAQRAKQLLAMRLEQMSAMDEDVDDDDDLDMDSDDEDADEDADED